LAAANETTASRNNRLTNDVRERITSAQMEANMISKIALTARFRCSIILRIARNSTKGDGRMSL
jgi:hypothetical protein